MNRMPLDGGLTPKMSRPRSTTTSVAAGKLTVTPLPPASAPPSVYWQAMVIDLMMVTAPNPPGSRQLISPPAAVLEMAPANVLQGAVRLHGLTSSPTPETHVRVACAFALEAAARAKTATARAVRVKRNLFIVSLLLLFKEFLVIARRQIKAPGPF